MNKGRPRFQVDPGRLKDLRNEAGLTQAELARRTHLALGKPEATAPTATKHYQKVEKTGRTSRAMAQALAQVLDTTVPVLQGEAPDESPDWIDSLEQQLRDRIIKGNHPALQVALEQEPGAANPERSLAVAIAARVEHLQLAPNSQQLADLVEFTGWTEAQLLRPVSLHGHWLLVSSVHDGRSTELVIGASQVIARIEESVTKFANYHESDTRITLREALPWMHVEVQDPRLPARSCRFSFVRFLPSPSGLQWTNPTWRDRFWLDESLLSWAATTANFVTGFDGGIWPRNLRALRLVIEKRRDVETWEQIALTTGELDRLPDEVLSNFQLDGNSHDLVTNWIASDLWETLLPLLADWPLACWQIRSGACIVLDLDVPYRVAASLGRLPAFGAKYRIRLVEEIEPGQLRPAPWRELSVKVTAERLQKCLADEAGEAAKADSLHKAFPPP